MSKSAVNRLCYFPYIIRRLVSAYSSVERQFCKQLFHENPSIPGNQLNRVKMSDDEEMVYKKPQKTIHYGTLDSSDWIKQNALEDIQSDEDEYEPEKKKAAIGGVSQATASLLSTGNINLSNEYFDLEQEMYVFNVWNCIRYRTLC